MNERMHELRQRRAELLARIEAQRGQVAEIGSSWKGPLALADRGVSIVRFLRAHPLVLAGVAVLVVLPRRNAVGLFNRAWLVWKGFRYIADLTRRR
jgi:hypothetical protein